jgi:hypothetical protein
VPYNLTLDQISISDEDIEGLLDEHEQDFGDAAMGYIADHIPWSDDDALERVFRGAIILYHTPEMNRSFGECLCQALIWEVG